MLIAGLIVCAVSYIASYYGYPVYSKDFYFIGHALGLFLCSLSFKGHNLLKDILVGFAFGRLFDEIYYFVLSNPESDFSLSLIIVIIWPILGFTYRKYKKETEIAVIFTTIGYWVKKFVTFLLNQLF